MKNDKAKDKSTAEVTTQEIVPVQPAGEVATPSSLLAQFAADAGAGSENITADAMALPFLRLLQAKSPEVENDPDVFKPGMLIHSITGKTYNVREKGGKPLRFIQAHFSKQIVEWGDREAGNGGLKARHACTPQALAVLETLPKTIKGKPLAPPNGKGPFPPARTDGNILEETAYHYWLIPDDDGTLEVGVLPLKSTGLTPSKKLMRMIDGVLMTGPKGAFKPPTFCKVYTVQSWLDKQKTGAQNTFMNVRFAAAGDVTEEMQYAAAMSFYKSIQGGTAKLDDAAEGGVEHPDAQEPGWVNRDDNEAF